MKFLFIIFLFVPSVVCAEYYYNRFDNGFTGEKVVMISDYDNGDTLDESEYGELAHAKYNYTSTFLLSQANSKLRGLNADRVVIFKEKEVNFFNKQMDFWTKEEVEAFFLGHELSHGLDNKNRYKELAGRYGAGWKHFEEIRSDINGMLYMWRAFNFSKEEFNKKIDQLIIQRSVTYDYTHLSSMALVVFKHKVHKMDKPIIRSIDMEELATEIAVDSISGKWNWYVEEFMAENGVKELNWDNTRGFVGDKNRVYSGAELMASAVWAVKRTGREIKFPIFFRLM